MNILLVGIILIILCITLYKSKILSPMFYVIVGVYLTWLTYIATTIPDNPSYTILYNNSVINFQGVSEVTSPTWATLCGWSLERGYNYQQFKCVLYALGIVLLFFVIKQWVGDNFSLIIGLYLIYPALLDIVQIRFFIAEILCLSGLIFLIKSRKWSIALFIFFVLLGASIHNTVIVYLVFLIIPFIKKNRKKFLAFCIGWDVFGLLFGSLLKNKLGSLLSDKQALYLNNSRGLSGLVLITLAILLLIGVSFKLVQSVPIENDNKIDFAFDGILCSLLFIPALPLAFNLYRLFRIFWFLFYILVALSIKYSKEKRVKLSIWWGALGVTVVSSMIMMIYLTPNVLEGFLNI